METIITKARAIKLVIFDVDGVLTDGSIYIGDDGQEYKAFFSRDGHGIRLLLQAGIAIGIITGRTSNVVKYRMQDLGIQYIYQGYKDKVPALYLLQEQTQIALDEMAYVGDDMIDLPVMSKVGLSIAVADAYPFVAERADWRTSFPGGKGAVREVCDMILDAQDKLNTILNHYTAS